jgi:uncharacterized protein (UPF0335 family)
MYKVTGEPHLIKDNIGIVQNNNNTEYQAYIAKRNAALQNSARIERLEQENSEIKEALSEILKLLKASK